MKAPQLHPRCVPSGSSFCFRRHDAWIWRWLDDFVQDVRQSVRVIWCEPSFAVVTLLAIALIMSANTLMFGVIDHVLLRPLPFFDSSRLVFVWGVRERTNQMAVSVPNFADWRARNSVFEEMGAEMGGSWDFVDGAFPEPLTGHIATASLFRTLGIQPQIGRLFRPEEERFGKDNVLLISDRLWRDRFNADPHVLGASIKLRGYDGKVLPHTIIGVLSPSLRNLFSGHSDLWAPMPLDSPDLSDRRLGGAGVIARLRSGVSIQTAKEDLGAVAAALATEYPDANRGLGISIEPVHESMTRFRRPQLLILWGAVAVLLILGCANVANLLLVRGSDRSRELTLRAALGASRGRLLRQLLTESLTLSLVGSAVGVVLAYPLTHAVRAMVSEQLPRAENLSIDGRVLLFTAVLSVIVAVLFGTVPAWIASSVRPLPVLARLRHRGRSRLTTTLVIGEVALAFVLLSAAALMANSFVRLLRVDPGFDRNRLIAISSNLPYQRYGNDPAKCAGATNELVERISSVHGVQQVAISDFRPLMNTMSIVFRRQGEASPHPANWESVTPRYFHTTGTGLVSGRLFTRSDRSGAPRVAIVNEAAARKYWFSGQAIGDEIEMQAGGKKPERFRVVGIVKDVRRQTMAMHAEPAVYVPQAQQPSTLLDIMVRLQPGVPPSGVLPAIRTQMATVDAQITAHEISSMDAEVAKTIAQPRFMTTLLSGYAGIALSLTLVGVFGVVAHSVRMRLYEFGVRLALGATPMDVALMVGRHGAAIAGAGLILGLGASFAVSRFLEAYLYEVRPNDTWTLVLVSMTLCMGILSASGGPLRRMLLLDPADVLRHE